MNAHELNKAAHDALTAWTATLSDEDRASLYACDGDGAESFEYIDGAADAVWAEYQLETDQIHEAMREASIYNVRHERGHRALPEEYTTAPPKIAEAREARATALVRSLKRKAKARRYHDIADICLGKDGTLLGSSAQARAHRKAGAQDFRAATVGLTVAQQTKTRRYMAKHGTSASEARAALGL